jgi:two-component sensor histidine kinase
VREGSFGKLPSEAATPLAMVLTEVLQNAVEHGYADQPERTGGRVVITARRIVGRLHVVVEDDGRGLPEDFDLDASTQLGLSIVRTLVESELGGVLEIGPGTRGARVQADLPVD